MLMLLFVVYSLATIYNSVSVLEHVEVALQDINLGIKHCRSNVPHTASHHRSESEMCITTKFALQISQR